MESKELELTDDKSTVYENDRCLSRAHERRDIQRSGEVSRIALRALYDELCLYPKPGLVSKIDTGSHQDMTAAMFIRSLFSLRHYFSAIYLAGAKNASFDELRLLGIKAEQRMLCATDGVNTHRGAIFNLGILCATLGKWDRSKRQTDLSLLSIANWGAAIKTADATAIPNTHGSVVCREYAVGGARGEASAGFPHVFKVGLPALRWARKIGVSESDARVQAFFAILASLDDTNLLHRGGANGLAHARRVAADFLASGGVAAADWQVRAAAIHHGFIQRRLSPGGSADLLAATLFVDRIMTDAI